jgi:hypothetical protein
MTRAQRQAIANAYSRMLWLGVRFKRERSHRRQLKNIVESVRLAGYIARAMDRVGYQP